MTIGKRHQLRVAAGALDQGRDSGRALAQQQIALPMARHSAVFDLSRTVADHHHVAQPPARFRRIRTPSRAPGAPAPAQMGAQLIAQRTTRLHEQRQIDRLMRHLHPQNHQGRSGATSPRSAPETSCAQPPARSWCGCDRSPRRSRDTHPPVPVPARSPHAHAQTSTAATAAAAPAGPRPPRTNSATRTRGAPRACAPHPATTGPHPTAPTPAPARTQTDHDASSCRPPSSARQPSKPPGCSGGAPIS